jgi:hypothetical protein
MSDPEVAKIPIGAFFWKEERLFQKSQCEVIPITDLKNKKQIEQMLELSSDLDIVLEAQVSIQLVSLQSREINTNA